MPRLAIRDFGTALKFVAGSTDRLTAPFTFSQTGFTVSFWYKMSNAFPINGGMFEQVGSFSFRMEATPIMAVYAYLNASGDFAGPRRLRIRGMKIPGTNSGSNRTSWNSSWHQRVLTVYINGSNNAKCDEYEDGVLLQTGLSVDFTGDTSTPSGSLKIGNDFAVSQSFGGLMDDVRIFNDYKATLADVESLYFNNINPQTPDSWWKLDEGSGTTAVDSGSAANTGTITGATYTPDVPTKPRLVAKDFGTALNVTSSGYVRNTSPISLPALNGACTLAGWFKIKSYSTTQFIFGIVNGAGSASTQIQIRSGTIQIESSGTMANFIRQPRVGEWVHLAFTYDGTTNIAYINGVPGTTTTTAHASGAAGSVYGSTYNGSAEAANAIMDELLVYNRALTAAEISALYYNGIIPTSGNVLQWLFNEGAGTTTADSSGTGNTGTIATAVFTADSPGRAR